MPKNNSLSSFINNEYNGYRDLLDLLDNVCMVVSRGRISADVSVNSHLWYRIIRIYKGLEKKEKNENSDGKMSKKEILDIIEQANKEFDLKISTSEISKIKESDAKISTSEIRNIIVEAKEYLVPLLKSKLSSFLSSHQDKAQDAYKVFIFKISNIFQLNEIYSNLLIKVDPEIKDQVNKQVEIVFNNLALFLKETDAEKLNFLSRAIKVKMNLLAIIANFSSLNAVPEDEEKKLLNILKYFKIGKDDLGEVNSKVDEFVVSDKTAQIDFNTNEFLISFVKKYVFVNPIRKAASIREINVNADIEEPAAIILPIDDNVTDESALPTKTDATSPASIQINADIEEQPAAIPPIDDDKNQSDNDNRATKPLLPQTTNPSRSWIQRFFSAIVNFLRFIFCCPRNVQVGDSGYGSSGQHQSFPRIQDNSNGQGDGASVSPSFTVVRESIYSDSKQAESTLSRRRNSYVQNGDRQQSGSLNVTGYESLTHLTHERTTPFLPNEGEYPKQTVSRRASPKQ